MKKRQLLLFFLALCLLLGACGSAQSVEKPEQQIDFYYARQEMTYGQSDSVIAAEARNWDQELNYADILQQYLEGPSSDELQLLVPENVSLEDVIVEDQTVQVTLSRTFSQLTGPALTISAACIAKTLLQFEPVQMVRICAQNAYLAGQESLVFTADTIVLTDEGGSLQNQTLRLYFSDADHRYLLETTCTAGDLDAKQLPEYLIDQLIQGPADTNMQPVIPAGTTLLNASMEGTLCIVDFSEEFFSQRPQSALEERMAIYAIVNTLTALDNVERVRILVEGERLSQYLYQDLTRDFVRDESLIGPVRDGLGEFDATLCLPLQGYDGLFACPVIVQGNTAAEHGRLVLQTLFDYTATNGYYSLLPAGITVNAFAQSGKVCVIDLSADPLAQCTDAAQMELCIQMIALTLQQSGGSQLLQINVNGVAIQDLHEIQQAYLVPMAENLNH